MRLTAAFTDSSIKVRISLLIVMTCSLALSSAGIALFGYESFLQRGSASRELSAQAGIIAESSTAALSFRDERAAVQILSALRGDSQVVESAIYDSGNHLFARYQRTGSSPGSPPQRLRPPGVYFEGAAVLVFQPIKMGDERVGTIVLKSASEVGARLRRYVGIVCLVLVLSLGLALLLSAKMQRAITQIERANAELASIVGNADAAIISNDLAGTVLTWNPAAERIYGYSKAEMLGRTMAALVPVDRRAEDAAFMEKLRCGEGVKHVETIRLPKSGPPIPVLLTLSPMQDRQGNFLGIAHVAEDMTHVKDLERQLAQTQKLESIGQLAAGIAHEINTPIQYIGDNGKFLKDAFQDLVKLAEVRRECNDGAVSCPGVVPGPTREMPDEGVFDYLRDEVPKAIGQLLEGVDQVARIVLAMKEFSHPGPAEKIPVDINRAIESTVVVSRSEWKFLAELTTDFDRELPPVPCLAGEFNQVILNLIVNAAHAISDVVKASGGMGRIHITTRGDGDAVEIRVSDTGCGITKANQSKVFDPFFTTKAVGKGTGQGLAIAYGVIVQKHGGTIQVESEPAGGTTFIIRLPLVRELVAA
jgi:PAS domain S-box-containing protein